jgi:GntR family transcriptional regulator, transcriptional repressor for pyruvate dehydrogenase complex
MVSKPKPQAERQSLWETVRAQSVSSQIVERVRDGLFQGELKPGDLLGSESDLALKLGVSRVPVRDAFKTLQALGIVEVKMGSKGGARIARGDPNHFADALAVQLKLVGITVEEMFDSQIAIEVMATELAAKHATEADLQKLRTLLGELQGLCHKPMSKATALRFTNVAMQFHEALVGASHNRALSAQFKALRFVLEPIYARRTSETIARGVIASHKNVLDAVTAGEAERACALMRRRLEVIRASHLIKAVED